MKKSKTKCEACSICGEVYTEDKLVKLDGKKLCPECLSRETTQCSHCGERLWSVDNQGTLSMPLCSNCYDEHYTSCVECGRIIHREDAYYEDGNDEPMCYRCYEENREHDYIEDTKEIDGSLESMQKIVGGIIQAIYPFDNPEIALICNDEGKLIGLPLNRALFDKNGNIVDIVAGTFFLCSAPADSENFESLTNEQIETYRERFKNIEVYVRW